MSRQGYIYLITNTVNGKRYVGQTSRDIGLRFEEHYYDNCGISPLHKDMRKYSVQNFVLSLVETISLEELDKRQKYWIKEFNAEYNLPSTDEWSINEGVRIIENDILIYSCADLVEKIHRLTDWPKHWLEYQMSDIVDNPHKDFLGYHFTKAQQCSPTDIVDLENWIKTLNARFEGQHIWCQQLDLSFNTVGEAAKYFLDKGLYLESSQRRPLSSLITEINLNLQNKTPSVANLNGLVFYRVPGILRKVGPIYCPELDKEFISDTAAASYFVNHGIWRDIKIKTAKARINDILLGVFPNYKGYTFKERCSNNE